MRGFYNGYVSLVLREIPFASIQYPFYELIKLACINFKAKQQNKPPSEVQLGGIILATNGAVAGAVSSLIVTPFDVLKTRIATADLTGKRLGMVEVTRHILQDEGFNGLYKGGLIRAGTFFCGGFAFFGIYERVKKAMSE